MKRARRRSSRRSPGVDQASAAIWRLLGITWLAVVAYWLLSGAAWVGLGDADFSRFLDLGDLRYRIRDLVENVLVAMPAGFALGIGASLLGHSVGRSAFKALVTVFLVALIAEVLQAWVTGRDASIWDVLMISAGGWLAGLIGGFIATRSPVSTWVRQVAVLEVSTLFALAWTAGFLIPAHLGLSLDMLSVSLAPVLDLEWQWGTQLWQLFAWMTLAMVLGHRRQKLYWILFAVVLAGLWFAPGRQLSIEVIAGGLIGSVVLGIEHLAPRITGSLYSLVTLSALFAMSVDAAAVSTYQGLDLTLPPALGKDNERLLVQLSLLAESALPWIGLGFVVGRHAPSTLDRWGTMGLVGLLALIAVVVRWWYGGPVSLLAVLFVFAGALVPAGKSAGRMEQGTDGLAPERDFRAKPKGPLGALLAGEHGGFIMLGAAWAFISLSFIIALQLPGVPYNIRELFAGGWVPYELISFPLFIVLALGLPSALAVGWLQLRTMRAWLLPAIYLAAVFPMAIILRFSVPLESIHDIVGTPVWGVWGDGERILRFLAFWIPLFLIPFLLALLFGLGRQHGATNAMAQWSKVLIVSIPLLWLGQWVVVDLAGTDNIIELIHGRGSLFSLLSIGVLLVLMTGQGMLLAELRRDHASSTFTMALTLALIVVLPLSWFLLNNALNVNGISFLLSPERDSGLTESMLAMRWAVVYVLVLAAFAYMHTGVWRVVDHWGLRKSRGDLPKPLFTGVLGAAVFAAVVLISIGPRSDHAVAFWQRAGGALDLWSEKSVYVAGRIRDSHPRIIMPELAQWDGLGPYLPVKERIELQTRARLMKWDGCGEAGIMNHIVCWLATGDDNVGAEAARQVRAFEPLLPERQGNYGDAWLLALGYDLTYGHSSWTQSDRELVEIKIANVLRRHLELLDVEGASLWHGRSTLAGQAWLLAVTLNADIPEYAELINRAHKHFADVLHALSLSEGWPEGYNYWINSRAFGLTLAAMATMNAFDGDMYAESVRATLKRVGLFHLYAMRPDGVIQGWGDEGPRVDMKDETQRVIDALLEATKDPAMATLSANLSKRFPGGSGYYPVYRWSFPLFNNPANPLLPGVQRGSLARIGQTLPTAELFGEDSLGSVFMRSGWEEDDTFVSFRAGHSMAHHGHPDAGHFTLFKGAPLAINASSYSAIGAENRIYYSARTVSKNSLLIMRPNESIQPNTLFKSNVIDGGQRIPMSTSSWVRNVKNWRDNLRAGLHYEGGEIQSFAHRPGIFSYVAADLSGAYDSTNHDSQGKGGRVSKLQRQLLYLEGEDRLIVRDEVVATDPSYTKKWLLHTVNRPRIDGLVVLKGDEQAGILESPAETARISNGRGHLQVTRIDPPDAVMRLVGGKGYEYYVEADGDDSDLDGRNMSGGVDTRPWFENGQWRIEIQPGLPRNWDRFLVVLSPSLDEPVESTPKSLDLISGRGHGVATDQSVVYFADRRDKRVSIDVAGAQTQLLVLGLHPRQQLSVNTGAGTQPVEADRNGVLLVPLAGDSPMVNLIWTTSLPIE